MWRTHYNHIALAGVKFSQMMGPASSSSLFFFRLGYYSAGITGRASPIGTDIRRSREASLCVGISRCTIQPTEGRKKPSLFHQQLTCFPEQSFKEKSFAIPEIASPLAKQRQRTTLAFEQRSKLEMPATARKTIDLILHNTSASPCSFLLSRHSRHSTTAAAL